jgi:hypothetical protein
LAAKQTIAACGRAVSSVTASSAASRADRGLGAGLLVGASSFAADPADGRGVAPCGFVHVLPASTAERGDRRLLGSRLVDCSWSLGVEPAEGRGVTVCGIVGDGCVDLSGARPWIAG